MLDDFEKKIKKINDTIKDKNISFSLFGDEGVTYEETSTFTVNNFKDARLLILNRDNFQCQICYKTSDLQIDHVIPRSLFAFSHPFNLQILCSNCNKNKGANRIWFFEPIIFKKNLNNKFEDYTSGMIYMHLSSFYDDELINLNNYGGFKSNQFQIMLECIEDVLNDKKMKKLDDHLNALKRLPKPRTRWRRVGFARWETEH